MMPGFGAVSQFAIAEGFVLASGSNASASGALSTVSIVAFSGSVVGDASASGAVSTVAISTSDGSGSGGSSASGSLATVAIYALDGSASGTGSVTASGGLSTITVSTLAGFASVSSTASASFVTITTIEQSGSAIGSAVGLSGLTTIGIYSSEATVSCDAFVSAQSSTGVTIGDGTLGDFPLSGSTKQTSTISILTLNGFGSGSASAIGITLPGGITLGDGTLGDFPLSGNNQVPQKTTVYPSVGTVFGSANIVQEFTAILLISQNGSAKAFNPPGWARSRLKRLTIATSYVKKVNNPRTVEFTRPIN